MKPWRSKRNLAVVLPLATAACMASTPVSTSATQPIQTAGGPPAQASPTTATSPVPGPTVAGRPAPSPSPRAWTWLAFGDSITQDAFNAPLTAWTAGWAAPAPWVVNAGIRGVDSAYALTQVDELLAGNAAARYVGVAFGTNDVGHLRQPADFKSALTEIVVHIKARGKVAMLSTIPYSTAAGYEAIPSFNPAVAEVTSAQGLAPGPDLYAWFLAHPEELGPDGIHMSAAGDQAIQRLWAEAAGRAGF